MRIKVASRYLGFGLIISILLLTLPIIFMMLELPFAANALFLSLLYSVLGMAWNLLGGYGGQPNCATAVPFGVGAYTTMILLLFCGVTPWIGMVVGGAFGSLVSLALAVPFFRLRRQWFMLATLASVTIFSLSFQTLAPGGSAGLQVPIVPPESSLYYISFLGSYVYIYLALALLAIEILAFNHVIKGRIGYYLQAIREDEDAAMAMGVNTLKYKMIAMALSAFFVGVAGGVYTVRYRYVDPYNVFEILLISVYPIIVSVLGGMYNFWGPILGSFIFMPLFEYLRSNIVSRLPRYYGLHYMIAGIIFLAISIKFSSGIMGWISKKGYLKRRSYFAEEKRAKGSG